MRRAGYYLATKNSEQRRFPKKLKVRRVPEYDGAPIEDRYKEQRRSYGEGVLMVVDGDQNPVMLKVR